MNKHIAQLERLSQKFQARYGEQDDLVKELQGELARLKKQEEARLLWKLPYLPAPGATASIPASAAH